MSSSNFATSTPTKTLSQLEDQMLLNDDFLFKSVKTRSRKSFVRNKNQALQNSEKDQNNNTTLSRNSSYSSTLCSKTSITDSPNSANKNKSQIKSLNYNFTKPSVYSNSTSDDNTFLTSSEQQTLNLNSKNKLIDLKANTVSYGNSRFGSAVSTKETSVDNKNKVHDFDSDKNDYRNLSNTLNSPISSRRRSTILYEKQNKSFTADSSINFSPSIEKNNRTLNSFRRFLRSDSAADSQVRVLRVGLYFFKSLFFFFTLGSKIRKH